MKSVTHWDFNREEHDQILAQIQLFLVDEVHILNESRGSTLEVIISRMKARGKSVRFVLVSATVPNIHDVASWIGNEPFGDSAVVMEVSQRLSGLEQRADFDHDSLEKNSARVSSRGLFMEFPVKRIKTTSCFRGPWITVCMASLNSILAINRF